MSFWKSIYTILTLSCDQASFLISKSQDVTLTRSEGLALSVHHKLCRFCRRYSRQLQALRDMLKTASEKSQLGDLQPTEISPEQKKRVLEFLNKNLS